MVKFHGEPPTHLTFHALEAAGVRHAFTTRNHGSFTLASSAGSPALGALGTDGASVRFARQVHGTAWLLADDVGPGLVGTGDALITTAARRPLAVFTADCLAVVLVDPERRTLALAHAGWRGTVGGILGRLVGVLTARFGARPEQLRAAIGPSIGPCCYEVDELVVGPLRQAFPRDWTRWARPRDPARAGKWWLDLWQANTDQLVAAGLEREAVWNPRLCTACGQDLFFSYRREGSGLRLAALALLA